MARLTDIWAASASGPVLGQLVYITTAGVFGTSGVDVGVVPGRTTIPPPWPPRSAFPSSLHP